MSVMFKGPGKITCITEGHVAANNGGGKISIQHVLSIFEADAGARTHLLHSST